MLPTMAAEPCGSYRKPPAGGGPLSAGAHSLEAFPGALPPQPAPGAETRYDTNRPSVVSFG